MISTIRAKIERHYSATRSLFTHYKIDHELNDPLIEYTRYVLDSGTEAEKTALASGIITKVVVRDGVLRFSNT
ncbi:MAG TPA: hypothetical protein VNE40_02385 [Candidatus Dormibacteraeota bacterium]|nr:hypothetical protein [Candidatus Dormibacteraeota bacterium]